MEHTDPGEARELSVTQARGHFTELVDHYEQLLDEHDARVATERLAHVEASYSETLPFDLVLEEAGLRGELGR